MRWKLGQFYFDANNNILSKGQQEHLLEPKVAELLSYFCQNPQRAISRDELIEQVWFGQVVSDSAINRIVVKLRKALDDNDKIKRFVVTVPKVGYKFAIKVEATTHNDELHLEGPANKKSLLHKSSPVYRSKHLYLVLCFIAACITYSVFVSQSDSTPTYIDAKVSPLSRLSTTQFEGAMSPDLRYLAFSAPTALGVNQLHIHDNQNNITHIVSPESGKAHDAYWSDDGQKLFYLFDQGQECEIHQIEISEAIFSAPKVVYQCADSQLRSVIHIPKEQKLLFIERGAEYAPWQVYSISLNTVAKRKVAQPIANGKGNYYLDRDRKTNRILLLHESAPGISQAFELNITDSTYRSLLTLPYMVRSALWGHDLNTIVHPGEHPSFDLVATSLASGQQQVLYSDSRRITDLNRINNGKDYLFSSYIVNRDIQFDGDVNALSNSSVMDYLPAISNDAKQLAFISKRSGYSKLWLQQIGTNQLRSIELEDQGRLFYHLDWSFDDKRLLANTNKGIVIYDIEHLEVLKVIDTTQTVTAAGWYSDEEVHYSEWHKQGWQLNLLNIKTNQLHMMDNTHAFVLADKVSDEMHYVHFDQQLSATWQGTAIDSSMCSSVLRRYRISWQFDNNRIYCRNPQSNAIIAIDNKGQTAIFHQDNYIPYHFSVSQSHWATWQVSSYVSDIIRTNFSDKS
ncbi:winged helix-turn-helix domain-containing protein [Pseudoalteromonas luteoviolacea]|uniref:winged helix-turn-helix domain-containing protein n=1 Tax=Pseudoalteromonas luteoviolacea TaxID=43657 RepID=UPI001B37944F|nr:winged helix-turn-helix domain-containing protein [Pseudoalteromonas luteoviolacea]MBQ4835754.1 winged helix-turn-helix domain-containing protein [Pseudoalteromonas luteoviolacea]